MTIPQTTPRSKDEALSDVQSIARDYFAARDHQEDIKAKLLDAVLAANEGTGATQQEIADVCDLSEGVTDPHDPRSEHKFHRTRVQQFLREARRPQ